MSCIDIVIPTRDPRDSLWDSIEGWLAQRLPDSWSSHIYLVDDGSVNGTPTEVAREYDGRITLVRHAKPAGRASARNSGSDAGRGELIAFFDSDCIPASNTVLLHFIDALSAGADMAFGRLEASGDSFWSRYVNHVSRKRESIFISGNRCALTSANCVCRRDIFLSIGKFDTRYREYGFEDRDLFARLVANEAKLVFVPRAVVLHEDPTNLVSIGRKLRTAGRFTSGLFMRDHPGEYAVMSFAHVDVRCNGVLIGAMARVAKPFLEVLLQVGDRFLNLLLPFRVKAGIVKLLSGLAFSVGTLESLKLDGHGSVVQR